MELHNIFYINSNCDQRQLQKLAKSVKFSGKDTVASETVKVMKKHSFHVVFLLNCSDNSSWCEISWKSSTVAQSRYSGWWKRPHVSELSSWTSRSVKFFYNYHVLIILMQLFLISVYHFNPKILWLLIF